MEQKQSSGLLGLLGLIGCAALYFLARRFFPALSTLLLWIFGIAAALIVVLVAVVLFFAFHKPKKTPEQERNEAQAAVLKTARASLMELRIASMRVRNQQVQDSAQRICTTLDQILKELKSQPKDIVKARSFLNHSLPLLSGIVRKYSRLEQSGVLTEEITDHTISCLRDLESAALKQYQNLFDNNIIDITADMEVLTQLCRKNGLLDDDLQTAKEAADLKE